MQKLAELPAEELSAALKLLPPETPEAIEAYAEHKDPKDPKDAGNWSASGPFGGDNLSALGLIPEATTDFGF